MAKRTNQPRQAQTKSSAGGGSMRAMRDGFRSMTGGGKKGSDPARRFTLILLSMFGAGLILYAIFTH